MTQISTVSESACGPTHPIDRNLPQKPARYSYSPPKWIWLQPHFDSISIQILRQHKPILLGLSFRRGGQTQQSAHGWKTESPALQPLYRYDESYAQNLQVA